MSLLCNFTNDTYCTELFNDVHVSITAIKSILSLGIVLISIPTNILLIVAMVKNRNMLDNSVFLAISFLVANIIVSLFLGGSTVVTGLSRGWWFGFWGCQVSSFITTLGAFARWVTVGLLSFDRFCRVFLPFTYPRHENKVIIVLLVSSWAIALFAAVALSTTNAYTFVVSIPACLFTLFSPEMTQVQTILANIIVWICRVVGTFFPISLYTAMYCKARRLKKKDPTPDTNSNTPQTLEARIRANKASLTYFFTTLAFIGANALIVLKDVTEWIFLSYNTPLGTVISCLFIFSLLIESYVIGDVIIILTNKQQRGAFKKLLKNIYRTLTPRKI